MYAPLDNVFLWPNRQVLLPLGVPTRRERAHRRLVQLKPLGFHRTNITPRNQQLYLIATCGCVSVQSGGKTAVAPEALELQQSCFKFQ